MAKSDGGRIGVLAGGRRLRLGRGGSSGGAAPSVATGFHLHGHGFLTTFLHPGRIGMSTHSSPPDAKFGFKLQSTLSQPSEEKNQSGWRCQSVGSYKDTIANHKTLICWDINIVDVSISEFQTTCCVECSKSFHAMVLQSLCRRYKTILLK
ncbi:hypothetical protein GUJ93_ZPchr0007g5688 [Zizania palustris]|uniref:Uncharacterized protein n=1 Tax=Zizania palustris TaxID=103762 RepID=A0A8J5VXS0_ZIZPA|nr:hypothetical protein GUJ93_ZPchr0007g5688 [Zizania palustris]